MFEVVQLSDLFHYTVWMLLALGFMALIACLNRWERGSAFLSGAAAASAFFSYLLLQVGLGDDLITGLFALISVASGSFSAYLYHKVKTEGGY